MKAKEVTELRKAWVEGQTLQVKSRTSEWVNHCDYTHSDEPDWSGCWTYRIKPEPRVWWVKKSELTTMMEYNTEYVKVMEVLK